MFRTLQNHPVALFVAAAGAFGAWLWSDAAPADSHPRTADAPHARHAPHGPHPMHPMHPGADPREFLPHLPPGLPRGLVELKLGLHGLPHRVAPVSAEGGAATYTVTYPLPGRPLVLEFDAARPEHPLVAARDTDPHS